ncbi:MAG: hypothetical protein K0M45_09045 [Candidatus Paracaedibacteraceae bacterium]|nr:hypothetical protein [Candidatus Paracaedibacteraceae bacterium]
MVRFGQGNTIKVDNLLYSSKLVFISLKYSSLALALLASSCYVSAATFMVSSTNDNGPTTLRDAILQGNDFTDSTIFINLRSLAGQLSLESPLPMISNYAGSNNHERQ